MNINKINEFKLFFILFFLNKINNSIIGQLIKSFTHSDANSKWSSVLRRC